MNIPLDLDAVLPERKYDVFYPLEEAAKFSDTVLNYDFPIPVFLKGQNPNLPASKFIYNFYEPRESVDDTGQSFSAISDPMLKAKPRYTQLFFKLPTSPQIETLDFSSIDLAEDEIDNKGNTPTIKISKINDEINSQGINYFVNIGLQDLNIDTRLYDLVSSTARKKIAEENSKISKEIDSVKESFFRRAVQSQSDLVRVLRRQLPDNSRPSDDFLANAINNISQLNEDYIDESEATAVVEQNFEHAKNAKFDVSLNSKLMASLISTAITDPIGVYSEELLPIKEIAERIQSSKIGDYLARDGSSGDLSIDFIKSTEHVGQKPNYRIGSIDFLFAGFVLEKTEIKSSGNMVLVDKMVINPSNDEANSVVEFLDKNVAYGRKYAYQVSALFLGKILLPNKVEPNNTVVRFGRKDDLENGTTDCIQRLFFVQSAKSKSLQINTIEKVPPKPPVNLKVSWHQENNGALITWNHPANKQKDIKRFQVFRRASIKESFEIIKEYDFDHSEVLYSSGENIMPSLKEKTKRPIYHFIDKNIDPDKKYIYAVRSIDAHGLGSQYSIQLECKYNRFTNKIDSKLFSTEGAPIQYPNFFVLQNKFVDTIKDSGHSRLKIYFDPEYLRLYKNIPTPFAIIKNDLKLFNFDGLGNGLNGTANFQLQILNTDLQKSQTVDIIIADDRQE